MKKTVRKIISTLLILSFSSLLYIPSISAASAPVIKNVIYMMPDGGAMAPFYLADAVKQAGGFDKTKYPNATPVATGEMYLKDYLVGGETTYCANYPITDSAASGTALSSGYKTNKGYIGIDPSNKPHATLLEACQDAGKKTGMVVTYEWTNASPAAFSAHNISRKNMTIMSEQIVNQGIDVVFGATHSEFSGETWFKDSYLNKRGYTVIKDRNDLNNIKAGDRVWGKLPAAYWDFQRAASTPNLAELTEAALRALDDGNEEGFFLFVEGSAVDGGGHVSDAVKMVSEYLAFDEACKVVIEFAKKRTDTAVIICPDHDTGGLTYDYSDLSAIIDDIKVGTNSSHITWTFDKVNTGTEHTARNGGVFMYLREGVAYPAGIDPSKKAQVASEFYNAYGTFSSAYPNNPVNIIDNTDVSKFMASLAGVDYDAVTEKLFVDVTDQGTYNALTGMFTFTDKDIAIKRNMDSASIHGITTDLDGEIAVYIEGRFYVPQKLLDIEREMEAVDGLQITADYNTGRISYSGCVGVDSANVSTVITKPNKALSNSVNADDILAVAQTKADVYGGYTFNLLLERLAGSYNIYTNYTDGEDTPLSKGFRLKNTIPAMNVTKNGVAVSKMNQLSAGDTINIALSGFDLASDYPGVVIVGQYHNGELVSAQYMTVTGGSAYLGEEVQKNVSVASNVNIIKIFYWNRNTYMPLTATYKID